MFKSRFVMALALLSGCGVSPASTVKDEPRAHVQVETFFDQDVDASAVLHSLPTASTSVVQLENVDVTDPTLVRAHPLVDIRILAKKDLLLSKAPYDELKATLTSAEAAKMNVRVLFCQPGEPPAGWKAMSFTTNRSDLSFEGFCTQLGEQRVLTAQAQTIDVAAALKSTQYYHGKDSWLLLENLDVASNSKLRLRSLFRLPAQNLFTRSGGLGDYTLRSAAVSFAIPNFSGDVVRLPTEREFCDTQTGELVEKNYSFTTPDGSTFKSHVSAKLYSTRFGDNGARSPFNGLRDSLSGDVIEDPLELTFSGQSLDSKIEISVVSFGISSNKFSSFARVATFEPGSYVNQKVDLRNFNIKTPPSSPNLFIGAQLYVIARFQGRNVILAELNYATDDAGHGSGKQGVSLPF